MIAELRALLAKATPGPWEECEQSGGDEWCALAPPGTNPVYPREHTVAATCWKPQDCAAIVAMRNSYEALLDVADAAQGMFNQDDSIDVRLARIETALAKLGSK